MKKVTLLVALLFYMVSCKNLDLPSVEESEKAIATYNPSIEIADKVINSKRERMQVGSDIQLRVQLQTFNKITNAFSNHRNDDISINFLPKKPFMKEDKSVLGIKYTNYLDIDTGFVSMNLKKLQLNKFEKGKVGAQFEIEGKGKINVSGKYTGIPASVSPDVELYLNEWVSFKINPTDSGYIVFKPEPKKVYLKTKFYIKLLEWKIPFSKDIELELTELLKPMPIPLAFGSDIMFPVPSSESTGEKLIYLPYNIQLIGTNVNADANKLEINSKVQFNKK